MSFLSNVSGQGLLLLLLVLYIGGNKLLQKHTARKVFFFWKTNIIKLENGTLRSALRNLQIIDVIIFPAGMP